MISPKNTNSSTPGFGIWLKWWMAHFIGWGIFFFFYICFVIIIYFQTSFSDMSRAHYQIMCLFAAGSLAVMQRGLLRRYVPLSWWWVGITLLIGGGLGLIMGQPVPVVVDGQFGNFRVFALTLGVVFILSVVQWWFMRPHLPASGEWVVVNLGSVLLAYVPILLGVIPETVMVVGFGIFSPCLTGAALVRLLRRSQAAEGKKVKSWALPGGILICLGLIGVGRPLYLEYRHGVELARMADQFASALQANQSDAVKALIAPEQWDRIDRWMANRSGYTCPNGIRFRGQLLVQAGETWRVDGLRYECYAPPYTLAVWTIRFEARPEGWVIANWRGISENINHNWNSVCMSDGEEVTTSQGFCP